MPTGMNEKRTTKTYSILDRTDEMISEMASKTYRSKANIIDLAVAELYSRFMAEPVLAEVAPVAEPANKE
ncbi:MAG TPA: hypothetical protein VJL34_13950 [Anaerolineales bacterium]|nr:hypothetical protein [Anaerolineales bacterium]